MVAASNHSGMHWRLFADLAETAGTEEVAVEGDPGTVGEALDALIATHPDLEARVFDQDGGVRDHVNVLCNGEALDGEGLATPVSEDDELALFPPVSGG
jgi:molybdopterin synthase sulfur carrier subunit